MKWALPKTAFGVQPRAAVGSENSPIDLLTEDTRAVGCGSCV